MEFIKRKWKNIIIIVLSVLFLVACVIIYHLARVKKTENILTTVSGSVIITDSSYVIIEALDGDYLVKDIKGNYKVGDEVKFTYYSLDLNEEDSLKTVKLIHDEELIISTIENNKETNTKPEVNEKENNKDNNITNTNTNNSANSNSNNLNHQNNSEINDNTDNSNNENYSNSIDKVEENTNADAQVLNHFNELKSDFDATSLKDSVKNGFITVVDFIFYNGKIKGYTFNELSDSAKLKVLSMALYFDSKIEKYFPGYKESISNTTNKIYTTVKEEIVSNYLELATIICSNNTDLCDSAKNSFNTIKENFGLTWSLIKDIAGDGLTNIKSWYEIWSGK